MNKTRKWHVINIKARFNQCDSHYIDVFRELADKDTLVFITRNRCMSIKSVEECEFKDNNNQPLWIKASLLIYSIIDQNAFYNRRNRKEVSVNLDSDIVSNKHEEILFFVPSIHILAIRKNSTISLNNVVLYLFEALNRIEPDGFDVSIICERDILDKILSAYAILRIEAKVSYSNPGGLGHTSDFQKIFEDKTKGMGGNEFRITAIGSPEHPLIAEEDGIIEAIVNMAEQNGTVKATIQSTETSEYEKINSGEHPRIIDLIKVLHDFYCVLYVELMNLFNHNDNDKQ